MEIKLNIIGIIPARMASSRLPGKPLVKIQGIPMVGHCYFRSKMSQLLKEVYVATCDQEIYDYVESIGGKSIMTSDMHTRASDRTAEALLKIESELKAQMDIVVMIQGDEPMLHPEMIDEAITPLIEDKNILVTNLMAPLKTVEEFRDTNEIKVVVDNKKYALYFSREPIPSSIHGGTSKGDGRSANKYKQVCIIPFNRDFLITFNKLPPTPLEISESIDMLRIMEHGYKVKMVPTQYDVYSVDTEQDRQKVEVLMEKDELIMFYR
jgi:3-deoxy-manno-octulosonate cytidylyltransferase (CMP-KDO synthetase)